MSSDDKATTYRDAGVDLEAAAAAVAGYRGSVDSTRIPGVLGGVGGFGGLFALRDAGVGLDDPVLVSATDGVGTKLRLAFELGVHDTVGIDCVAMCVNDIVVTGAKPLFFLDYLATGRLDPGQATDVVAGIAAACRESGCALIGGETAEMPGFYGSGEYDIAGFCVGVADRSELFQTESVASGDAIIGLTSTGFHSNGYSLVRKIIDDRSMPLDSNPDVLQGETLGAALLRPTRLYPSAFAALRDAGLEVKSAAHITGGGFYENLPRALPQGLGARIDAQSWEIPAIISYVCDAGSVAPRERYNVFNMGIGMAIICDSAHAAAVIEAAGHAEFEAVQIGEVVDGDVIVGGISD